VLIATHSAGEVPRASMLMLRGCRLGYEVVGYYWLWGLLCHLRVSG
jgi:hypothetical protein